MYSILNVRAATPLCSDAMALGCLIGHPYPLGHTSAGQLLDRHVGADEMECVPLWAEFDYSGGHLDGLIPASAFGGDTVAADLSV